MNFSIIVCTYNPEPAVFSRSLRAVISLKVPEGKNLEIIIVDNNSTPEIDGLVENILKETRGGHPCKIVKESMPGLLHARKKGFDSSSGEIILFFDDDNEPEINFLEETDSIFSRFPSIGVCGPGNIAVEYFGNVEPWLNSCKGYFQKRNFDILQYACYPHWLDFYPPGTGQCVRRKIYGEYLQKVKSGEFSAIGRTKKSMASAEDVQLVFWAICMQFSVASVPELRLNHLISQKKTTSRYIMRLLFGMSSSYPEAYAECFPHTRSVLPYFTDWQILKKVWFLFWLRLVLKKSPRSFVFQFCELLGRVYGSNLARGGNTKSLWFRLIPFLRLN